MVLEAVPNEIAITKLEMTVIEMIAIAAKDPRDTRAIRGRLTTALRCMAPLVLPQPIADAHSVVRSIVVRSIVVRSIVVRSIVVRSIVVRSIVARNSVVQGDMAHHDMNRALAAPIIAAQALAIVVDARTKAIRVTTIPQAAPQIAVAKCTAAQKIIAVQNNMPRATIMEANAAPARAPMPVPASSAAAGQLLPPGVSAAQVQMDSVRAHSDPVASALLALVAEVSVLPHRAAVDLAEASASADSEAASAARPRCLIAVADHDDLRELQNDAQKVAKKVPAAQMKIAQKKAIAPKNAMRNAAPVAALMPVQRLGQNHDQKPEAKIDPVAVLVAMMPSQLMAHAAVPDLAVLAVVSAVADLAARSAEVLAQAALVEVSAPAVAVLATRLVADEVVVAAKAAQHVLSPTKTSRINLKKSPRKKMTRIFKLSAKG